MSTNKIFVVDHYTALSQALRRQIDGQFPFQFACLGETQLNILSAYRGSIVLIDLQTDSSSYALLQSLVAQAQRVIVVSSHSQPEYMLASYYLGAAGFLPKSFQQQQLHDALATVLRGELAFAPALLHALAHQADYALPELKKNEQEVLSQLMATPTPSNPEMAAKLGVSFQHIKNLVNQLCAKFAVHNRNDLVKSARQRGFVAHAQMPRLRVYQRKKGSGMGVKNL